MSYNVNQSGRSMIEMLGVLAIIGVLSVGGIAGYSKAMTKFKINKSVDQISQIAGNIRTLYGTQKRYVWSGNRETIFKKAHIIPDEMWEDGYSYITNPFGGNVHIDESGKKQEGDQKAFYVSYTGLPEEACMELSTYDWGSGSSSGLVAVAIGGGSAMTEYLGCSGNSNSGSAIACPNGSVVSVPMPVNVAASACDCGDDCTFTVKFY
ncbi:MAG: hypothetical protein J6N49_06605 [Alphaproteobacteria bacterium]|nr:hypothetical protein [Alphaproteobacteria bacterium]